jgi:choline kinase
MASDEYLSKYSVAGDVVENQKKHTTNTQHSLVVGGLEHFFT